MTRHAPPPASSRRRRLWFVLLSLVVGGLGAVLVGEIALRVYNPVRLPLRGKRIVLPVNRTLVWHGPPANSPIDPVVVVKSNELGFRGPSPPEDFAGHLTIVTVGGSTTECRYLTDGKDWPAVLADRLRVRLDDIWVNNAGLDGHSTFGHRVLLDQVILDLKPDYVLFLIGVNDIGHEGENTYDATLDPTAHGLGERIVAASELLSTVQALARTWRARELGLGHLWELDLRSAEKIQFTPEREEQWMDKHRRLAASGFRERLESLVRRCRERGIEPVLLTQPALFGDAIDPVTGVDIAPLRYSGRPAALAWRILELYNDVTRELGAEQGVLVVDLAAQLPRDSSLYYDWMHFTNAGAERAADLVARELLPFLVRRGTPTR